MPPFPVVENAVQLTVHGVGPSALTWENVYGINLGGAPLTQAVADGIADYVSGAYLNFYGSVADEFAINSMTLTDLRTVDGPQFETTSSLPIAGSDTAQPLPLQTCALITWNTARRGRSFRGRTYLCGFTESASDGAHIESATLAQIVDFADAMIDPGLALGIISRFELNDSPPPASVRRDPGIITDVTSRVVHDLWATQRRRAPR